jgi:hypothetical protein
MSLLWEAAFAAERAEKINIGGRSRLLQKRLPIE